MRIPLFILILFFALSVRGTIFTAASAAGPDVQAKVNLCSAGDTVISPPGTNTWTSTLTITKGITLIGAGALKAGNSTFGNGGSSYTIITSGTPGSACLTVNISSNEVFTMKGFNFLDNTTGCNGGMIQITTDGFSRVCSNYFGIGGRCVFHYGFPGILFDNNWVSATFSDPGDTPTGFSADINQLSYLPPSFEGLWDRSIVFGTKTNWDYVEHNVFDWEGTTANNGNGSIDGYNSCAICFRYNFSTNIWAGMHGYDSTATNSLSPFGIECYSNVFDNSTANNQNDAMDSRGGGGLYWGNAILGGPFNHVLNLRLYRADGGNLAGGMSTFPDPKFDGYISGPPAGAPTGYYAFEQEGRTGPTVNGYPTSTNWQPRSPNYYWSNNVQSHISYAEIGLANVIITNYDLISGVPMPGYTPLAYPYPLAPPPPATPTGFHVFTPL